MAYQKCPNCGRSVTYKKPNELLTLFRSNMAFINGPDVLDKTNSLRCPYCQQVWEIGFNRQRVICPQCQAVNIKKKFKKSQLFFAGLFPFYGWMALLGQRKKVRCDNCKNQWIPPYKNSSLNKSIKTVGFVMVFLVIFIVLLGVLSVSETKTNARSKPPSGKLDKTQNTPKGRSNKKPASTKFKPKNLKTNMGSTKHKSRLKPEKM